MIAHSSTSDDLTQLAAFFHCWTPGHWRPTTFEFLTALNESGFPGQLYVGLVGPAEQRAEALAEIRAVRPAEVVAEAEIGWEQLTIHALHDYSKSHDGVVIYGHAKGSWHGGDAARARGRAYVDAIARRWRSRLISLTAADATGFADPNFWMVRCSFLRSLPPCSDRDRKLAAAYHWFSTGARAPVCSRPRMLEPLYRTDGLEPDHWRVHHLSCPTCGAGAHEELDLNWFPPGHPQQANPEAFAPSDVLVINEDWQAAGCRHPVCPFDSIRHRLLELQAAVDRPLDLEDLASAASLESAVRC